MGVSAADYDGDGNLDIFKTNFAGDTHSLYRNRGKWQFDDSTFSAGIGLNTRFLGWGCGFFDIDNDGWPDILVCNGHVYPEVEQLKTEAGYAERKLLYRIILPAALPYVFSGIRVALPVALIIAFTAEMIAGGGGLDGRVP